METAFDPFENSSNPSESEIEVIDSVDNYYDGEDDGYGSYDEVTLEDSDAYEENYHSSPEISHSSRINNDAGSDYIRALGPSNGGFTTIDEVDENYLDETSTEKFLEDLEDVDASKEDSVVSVATNDIVSDNDSFKYLSISDNDNSAAESSVKYDADVDIASQQASSTSSYSDAINDDSKRHLYTRRFSPPRRIKTTEEGSLGISSTSFRSSSFASKNISNAMLKIGDGSIRSTGQSPTTRKNVRGTSSSSARSVKTISENERSKRSESTTMVSRGTFTNSRQSLKTNGRETSRRKKSQRAISDHSTSVPSSGENSEERSLESEPSTASRRTSGRDSRANKESYRLQRKKHFESTPISPTSSTASYSIDEHFSGNDGRCASIAVLGTMSGTGKSIIAAALCRIFANGGTKCAPFKSQNTGRSTSPALLPDLSRRDSLYDSFAAMVEKNICNESMNNGRGSSLSIAPTEEQGYGQIGMAQSMQAEACKIVPRVQMNPIFFKSGGRNEKDESMCAVIVMGRQIVRETYEDISKRIPVLQSMVLDSHLSLAAVTGAEVIVIQGAGSCSELNLMDGDIVNLPLVRCLQVWY
jgi:hypothetical protein